MKDHNNCITKEVYSLCAKLFFFTAILAFFIIFKFYFGEVLYCDSIEEFIAPNTIDNITYDNSVNNNDSESGVYPPSTDLKYRNILRRKLHWVFIGKDSGKFNTYEEFKKTWDPKISLRSHLKKEFKSMIKNPLNDLKKTKEKIAIQREKDELFFKELARDTKAHEARLFKSKQQRVNIETRARK